MRLVKLSLLCLVAVSATVSGCSSHKQTRESGRVPGQGAIAYPAPSWTPPGPQPSGGPAPGITPKHNGGLPQPGGTSNGPGGQGDATGDFLISLSGDCVLYQDSAKAFWIKPTLQVNWLGATEFPAVAVAMSGDYMTQKATSRVSSPDTFGLPMGIQAAAAGRTIMLTAAVDPNKDLPEFSENNNVAVIAVTVPSALPSDSAEHTVSCHA